MIVILLKPYGLYEHSVFILLIRKQTDAGKQESFPHAERIIIALDDRDVLKFRL